MNRQRRTLFKSSAMTSRNIFLELICESNKFQAKDNDIFSQEQLIFFMNHNIKINVTRLTRTSLLANISRKLTLLALLETVCQNLEESGASRFSRVKKASLI